MKVDYISVVKDFSPTPRGRNENHGPNNGLRFRQKVLLPRLLSGGEDCLLVVDLSGTNRYGSSFLEEAFGGLVRVA